MASVEVSKLSANELAELSCTYASLILYDDGQDITADKIGKLITTSGVKIEPYWPKLFATALEGKDISSFFNFAGSAPAGEAPAAVAKAEVKKEAPKKQEKKPEPEPEEEEGMGGLFD